MEAKIASVGLGHKFAIIFASVLALALTACSQQDQDAGQPNASGSSTSANSPAQPPAGSVAPASFSAYTGAFPSTFDNKQCSVDALNGQGFENAAPLASNSAVVFGGWAGDGKGKAANGFLLVLKGEQNFAAPIQTTVARGDVAKAWGSEGMANSGFNLSASLTGVVAGDYAIYIADPANPSNVCDAHRAVTVR